MEGFRTQKSESVERGGNWRELKEKAPQKAEARIDAIFGFDEMDFEGQVAVLEEVLEELVDEADNEKRYLYGELNRRKLAIEELARSRERLVALGVTTLH